MDWDEVGDQVGHFFMAVAGLVWPMLQPDSAAAWTFTACWFAWWREDAVHRVENDDGWGWFFIGPGGRRWDIFWGTVGGATVGLVAAFK